jgi:hypothetical protein
MKKFVQNIGIPIVRTIPIYIHLLILCGEWLTWGNFVIISCCDCLLGFGVNVAKSGPSSDRSVYLMDKIAIYFWVYFCLIFLAQTSWK